MSDLDKLTEFVGSFDGCVFGNTRSHTCISIAKYENNKTREKLVSIILNLPLGAFIQREDIVISDQLPNLNSLIDSLKKIVIPPIIV